MGGPFGSAPANYHTASGEAHHERCQASPDGYHTITPYLCIKGAADAIEFYKKAFNAEELCRMPGPDGKSVGMPS